MNKLNKLVSNKIIITILLASITYLSFCKMNLISYYGEVSWLLYALLIFAYYKTDIYNKNYKKDIIILSIFFSLLSVMGYFVLMIENNISPSLFSQLFSLKSLLYSIGLFNFYFVIMTNTIPKICNYKPKFNEFKIKSTHLFLISFIIIFMCWIPYFLRFFPGLLSPDSMSELNAIINNFSNVSDHHPVFHILLISVPYKIGFKIFDSVEAGIACFSIFQMIIMSSIFSSNIVFLKNRKVNKKIIIFLILLYALLPLNGYYSITMWKDILFSGAFLLLIMSIIKIIEKKENLKFIDFIPFIISSLLSVFLRNNAIYMYIVLVLFTFILLRKQFKYFIVPFVIVFSVYYIIKIPLFNALEIKRSSSKEYLAIPMQQIGRMAYKGIEFTDEETKLINDIIPLDTLRVVYDYRTVDTIKFNSEFSISAFDDKKLEYLKLWSNLVIKHPKTAVEAYIFSTTGYWYPSVQYGAVGFAEYKFKSKVPKVVEKIVDKSKSMEIPIFNIQWSIGMCVWIFILLGYLTIKIRGKEYLYPYIPVLGIWITMMLATPVFAEFRYVYGLFLSLPTMVLFPFMKLKCSK